MTMTEGRMERLGDGHKAGTITEIRVPWVSDASQNYSETSKQKYSGIVAGAVFIPGTGATAPTDGYDVTAKDSDGVDLLDGNGANCTVPATKVYKPGADGLPVVDSTIVFAVATAGGTGKTGTIVLKIRKA